jgi:hypothetical protein
MAVLSNPFRFGNRASRTIILSPDKDGGPDGHDRKALLAGEEDDYGSESESVPPYRSTTKHWRVISFYGLGTASGLLVGLLTMCFFWHITMHKSKSASQEMQPSSIMKSPLQETQPSSIIPVEISNALDNAEESQSEFDEDMFADWQDCGSSVEEARAKGCFFDVMLHSWINEECADKELMDQYLTKVPYHWYRDWKSKEEITVEEMRLGEHGVAAVKVEEHGTHCAYVLEKNMRALMNGKPIARSIYSVKHAVHCLGLLVDPSTIPGDFTQVVVEFDQCGIPHFD